VTIKSNEDLDFKDRFFKKPHYYRKPTKKNPCLPWFKPMEKPIKKTP